MRLVLDASAALAGFRGETGAEAVYAALDGGIISAVNHAEFVAVIVRTQGAHMVGTAVSALALPVYPVDAAQADLSGRMIAHTQAAGLSLGDRFCLALAATLRLPALTADRKWLEVADAVGVEVRLIR